MDKFKESLSRSGSYFRLLVYAEPTLSDKLLLIVGIVTAIASGIPFPLLGVLFGQLVNDISTASCAVQEDQASRYGFQGAVDNKLLVVTYIGIGNLVLIYVYIVSWNLFGERLAQRVREKYLRSLLYKDVSFFDTLSPGEVSSHLNADITAIQQGTSEKIGIVINACSFFVTGYIIAFIKDPKLAAILISLTPAFMFMSLGGGHYTGKYASQMSAKTASASSMALESISSIMIVHAFGANKRLELRFQGLAEGACSAGTRKAIATSVQSGILYLVAYSANALAYWQGSAQIAKSVANNNRDTTIGIVYTVIFILVDATIVLSTVAPFIHVFGAAQSAFAKLEKGIAFQSTIESVVQHNQRIQTGVPTIALRDVYFAYPSRSESLILQGVSLMLPAGKHTAIVGPSGSGKSTVANLIMRLYDPIKGSAFFDEDDIQTQSTFEIRSRLSLVQQEPSLFNRSILENIAYGLSRSVKHGHLQDVLNSGLLADVAAEFRESKRTIETIHPVKHIAEIIELVRQAAQVADAHRFISRLHNGYGTIVGSKGALISGGQKQRISIARALVKDPSILILDEATAALDSHSERRIHAALSEASKGRTTLSIAHRLSSIRDADNIIVMAQGQVVEQGSHDELVAAGGTYAEMVTMQVKDNNDDKSPSGDATSEDSQDDLPLVLSTSRGSRPSIGTHRHSALTSTVPQPLETMNDNKDTDIDQKRSLTFIGRRVAPLLRPHRVVLLLAFAAIIVVGGTYSAAAAIFGNTLDALSTCNGADAIAAGGRFFALMFFVLGVAEFLANIAGWSGFGYVSEKVLCQFRILSFRTLLEQNLQWHEAECRTPSSLLSILTSDVNAIGGLTGSTIGTIFSVLVNVVVAIILTNILAWKIALVCLAVLPVILGAGTMQLIVLSRFAERHAEAFTNSVNIAVEGVDMIRTVKAFSLQDDIMHTYRRSLIGPIGEITRKSLYANMWLALAYGLPIFVYALAYWWGTKQIIAGEYSQTKFFIVLVALLVSAQLWGQLFTLAPDVSKAWAAAKRVVNLIHLGLDQSQPEFETILDPEKMKFGEKSLASSDESIPLSEGASVQFSDICFSYPAQPQVQVLHNLSLSIRPGQFAALCGPSGAGKSTIIALLERMYFPSAGSITIDDQPIASAPLAFRDSIAFVPQDNVLFEGTVAFNVSIGARPKHTPSQEEISEACKIANIHDTICALPNGYETDVGTGGSQFSGGQRQRLAIARALLRKPRLLLLDESTSALDAESEKVFRDALEAARCKTGMTVIAIAHRLNTIRSADLIFYLEEGRVVQQGTHEDLIDSCPGYRVNAKLQGF